MTITTEERRMLVACYEKELSEVIAKKDFLERRIHELRTKGFPAEHFPTEKHSVKRKINNT